MPKVSRPQVKVAGGGSAHIRTSEMMPWSFPWLRRKVTTYAFGTILCGALIITFAAWMGGGLGKFGQRMDAGFTVILHSMGMTVDVVEVEGVDPAARERLLAAADLQVGKSMLSADPWEIKRRIEQLPTVGSVTVRRLWPSKVVITAEARRPMAMWRKDGQWAVIDQRGHAFAAASTEDYSRLPKVEGEGAPEATGALLAMLSDYPDLAARVESARRVGGRRWDVKFREGFLAVLPEDARLNEALSALNLLNAHQRVLEQPITRIDCRYEKWCAMVPAPGAPPVPGGA
jgi:cell division protein FtsQ